MQQFGQRFLVVYSGVLTLIVSAAALSGFTSSQGGNARFDTITVQRINVVEPNGTLRMVLSNNNRIPAIIMHGREYPDFTNRKASTSAGILFYDAHASESGGLTFGGRKDASGTVPRFGHLSFDRHDQDQMFSIDAIDDGVNHLSQITMIDQPNWSIVEYLELRVRIQNLPPAEQQQAIEEFLQTHPAGAGVRTLLTSENYPDVPEASRNTLLFRDPARQERTRLGIDSTGAGALEFLDSAGAVTHRYPPQTQAAPTTQP